MIAWILLTVFVAGMVAVGLWGMKKTTTLGDFFLGGRTIGPWMSAFAYGTTYFSAVLFIGFAGKLGWGFGLNCLWIAVGNTIGGALLSWIVLGRRTRVMTHNLSAMTMPEFFQERYGARSLKLLSALVIFIFLVPYSASVFKGLAYLFETNFKINYDLALGMMIAITGIYLVLGGYFAVALTDSIQGIIMLVGAVVMFAIMTGKAGGLGNAIQSISQNYAAHVPPAKQPAWWILASLVFMTSFGVWALPQMVQKFYAIKDEKMIVRAAIITTIFAGIVSTIAYFNGALAHHFLEKPLMAGNAPDWDRMVPYLLTQHLPEMLMALILLLVLSASMSTLASLVLVSSSAVTVDFYQGHVNPNMSKKDALRLMRAMSIVFIVLSYLVARFEFGFIVTLMSLSWGAVAGAFLAPYLYSLFWKRTTLPGVYAGMFVGLALAIGLFFRLGAALSPVAASIAMIAPLFVVPIVSLLTQPPSAELIDKAFAGIGHAPPPRKTEELIAAGE